MNRLLQETMRENTPQFTKHVVEGAAKEVLKSAPNYIDDIVTKTVNTMGATGLTYHGWRKMTPKEEFDKLFTVSDKRIKYDFATSDLYLIELRFVYKGTPIPKYLYLPYADKANLMKISDTVYHITPILSNAVISPDHRKVFVRLLKDKLSFNRHSTNFILNKQRVPGQIIYSNTYHVYDKNIVDNLGKVYPSISLYLLGEMGFSNTLKKYANVTNFIITTGDVDKFLDTHDIYESTKQKPAGYKDNFYIGHDLKILIPKKEVTNGNKQFLDNFLFGIINVFDIFPNSVDDAIELITMHDIPNELFFWRLSLGRIIFKNGYSVDKMILEMDTHFNKLQNYMDNVIVQKLKDAGNNVETYFDLVALILSNFNTWLLNSKEYKSDISNRYVDLLYYILYDIIVGMNKALADISNKTVKNELSIKGVNTVFISSLSPKTFYKVVKSSSMNLTVNVVSYSGDIMYPKVTSIFKDQEQGNGVNVAKGAQFPEETRTLRGYDLWLGSLLFLSKSAPSPKFRLNMFMNYSVHTDKLLIPEKLKPTLDHLDKLLLGKEQHNKKIIESENVVTLDSVE